MTNSLKSLLLILFVCLISATGFSQNENTSTISVTGKYAYNLSPNEIIIKINYQEYFTSDKELPSEKVRIDKLERLILKSLKDADIKEDKITMGSVSLVRPKHHGVFQKRRINKSMFVCISTTDEFIKLINQFEEDNLFDQTISQFLITQYNHTEKETYLTNSRKAAFKNAEDKAKLILEASNQKIGKVISIKEIGAHNRSNDFYSFDNSSEDVLSGFQPISISYSLEVVFEIVD